jgi:hypothetical protein
MYLTTPYEHLRNRKGTRLFISTYYAIRKRSTLAIIQKNRTLFTNIGIRRNQKLVEINRSIKFGDRPLLLNSIWIGIWIAKVETAAISCMTSASITIHPGMTLGRFQRSDPVKKMAANTGITMYPIMRGESAL